MGSLCTGSEWAVYVQAVNGNFEVTQELAGLASLHERATGLNIFKGI